MRGWPVWILALGLAPGCATLGPAHRPPEAPAPRRPEPTDPPRFAAQAQPAAPWPSPPALPGPAAARVAAIPTVESRPAIAPGPPPAPIVGPPAPAVPAVAEAAPIEPEVVATAAPGPAAVAGEIPKPPAVAEVRSDPPPAIPPPPPAEPKGRPVARVGDEVITLPELTRAVRARLAQLPPGASPARREVIALARSVLKGMVVRSLVFQEARGVLGGSTALAEATARIEGRWDRDERPALAAREGAATEADLRARLAARSTSPEVLRDEFVVRTLALDLMAREGGRPPADLDGYLDALRKRRPIASIMTPAELASAGRKAAAEDAVAR